MSRSDTSFNSDGISSDSAGFAERLLAQFLKEPSQVPAPWRRYFIELLQSEGRPPDVRPRPNGAAPEPAPQRAVTGQSQASAPRVPAAERPPAPDGAAQKLHLDGALLQDRVDHLIRAYRVRGHLAARLDPLGLPRSIRPDLALEAHGLTPADLDRSVSA
ncbi:MAG TPA: hypothetical protein VHX68_16685, partial [Planctomycetaceae bacterium]|nr:hypothetical protein [Planctomycetaceae bacterium]